MTLNFDTWPPESNQFIFQFNGMFGPNLKDSCRSEATVLIRVGQTDGRMTWTHDASSHSFIYWGGIQNCSGMARGIQGMSCMCNIHIRECSSHGGGCTWFAAMFKWLLRVKEHSPECHDPRFPCRTAFEEMISVIQLSVGFNGFDWSVCFIAQFKYRGKFRKFYF